jgi:osmotically-inducible protein OsmY
MKRNVFHLALVLALFTGFVLAQNPGAQDRPDSSQPSQSQPTPQAQQPAPDTQAPAPAQSQPQANTPGAQIQAALQKEAALSNVMVNETSDKIELAGTVATEADKDKARSIAESNAAGHKVVNNIKVGSSTSSPSSTTPPPPR